MKTLGVVTLYHPSQEVKQHIASYLDGLDGLFIWDNTKGGSEISDFFGGNEKTVHVRRGENVGIGMALNEAARYAIAHEYTHLLTMDQDSAFLSGEFADYLAIIAGCTNSDFFQFCPSRMKRPAFFPPGQIEGIIEETPDTIISGTVTPVSVLQELGLFYEPFVMDAIDTEYGLRIHRAGGKIGKIRAVYLKHQLGYPLRKRFLWWTLESFNYSPMRTYYITRNFLFLRYLYPEYDCKYIFKLFVLRRFIRILCIEQDKWQKMKALFAGTFQGLTRRMHRDLFINKMKQA